VPFTAGDYIVSVKLVDIDIKGSPYYAKVQAGEVSSQNSFTSIKEADLLSIVAGQTFLFTVSLVDIYGNAKTSAKEVIQILAEY